MKELADAKKKLKEDNEKLVEEKTNCLAEFNREKQKFEQDLKELADAKKKLK